ncbi:hypothetical protein CGMCC3_g17233 [Colletotrichum fructicola]|nr:uncharacterized protein CGMCC3_g17233 [Colletotrichum fructicola]KAE9566607.1 hypothetical protein CGMCC3_g17233 [Colletotrichum fructicola]
MTSEDAIITWIASLPPPAVARQPATSPTTAATSHHDRPRKRKRTSRSPHSHRLPSPPKSTCPEKRSPLYAASPIGMDDCASASSDEHDVRVDVTPRDPKRLRTNPLNLTYEPPSDVNPDLDPTPRNNRHKPTPAPRTSRSHASSLASHTSDLSLGSGQDTPSKKRRRQSSPRKQTVLLTMENAVEHVNLNGDAKLPDALDKLVLRIEDLGKGNRIISHAEKETLYQQQKISRRFRWVKGDSFDSPPPEDEAKETRDELGPTPALETVNRIWSDAEDCQNFQHFEIQWNCAVHFKILEVALAHFRRLGFCICTGVQIHSDYTRGSKASHHNKKVDFCVFVNEQCPELTRAALTSPFQSVNQTEYPALLQRPIALSIETKVTGQDWTEAVNQISVWLLAQWDALDDLVSRSQAQDGDASSNVDAGDADAPKPSAAAAAGLVFLPGLVVLGHDWYFVAMTRSPDGKSRLYNRVLIGSTQSTEGVYQVIAVLQLLGRNIENHYWPWFERTILNK